jgi:hypothetical protein
MSMEGECPCGQSLENLAQHVMCRACRAFVRAMLERRFGAGRFGGRVANRVEDIEQDLYAEQLLRPGGLGTFRPPPDPQHRFLACRKWLAIVVRNFSDIRHAKIVRELSLLAAVDPPEGCHAATGEREYLREWARSVVKQSYQRLCERYARSGQLDYLETLAPFLIGPEPDSAEVAAQLGKSRDALKKNVFDMRERWRYELRWTVRDTLIFPPGTDRAAQDRLIDQEIEELSRALFADGEEWTS